jgi:hypothetical protein
MINSNLRSQTSGIEASEKSFHVQENRKSTKDMGSLENILISKFHGHVKDYGKLYLGFEQKFDHALLADHSARVIFVLRLPVSHHGQSFRLQKFSY